MDEGLGSDVLEDRHSDPLFWVEEHSFGASDVTDFFLSAPVDYFNDEGLIEEDKVKYSSKMSLLAC